MANVYIDALAGHAWTEFGSDQHITYYLDDSGYRAWTAAEQAGFAAALQTWANVANITFERVASASAAELTETLASSSDLWLFGGFGTIALHGAPNASGSTIGLFAADGSSYTLGSVDLVPGSVTFETLVHELGHALGLAHPHDTGQDTTLFPGVTSAYTTGTGGLNQTGYTVMSYNEFRNPSVQSGRAAGPMAFDIAAIQSMYGANTNYRKGNDVYSLNSVLFDSANPTANIAKWLCLWDAGGTDTISYSGAGNVTIDLRPATLVPGVGAGGFLSEFTRTASSIDIPGLQGGYTIANGVTIEIAIGGSGNDTLIGNTANNVLYGNSGNDRLDGGAGTDILYGGAGNDVYVLTDSLDRFAETAGYGTDTIIASFSYTLADGSNVENLWLSGSAIYGTGNQSNNSILGNKFSNTLRGGGGDDTLNGGEGFDVLYGGLGNDTYVLDAVNDIVTEAGGGGIDTILTSKSRSLMNYTGIENMTLSGLLEINATGNQLANMLTGNSAANILDGGLGADRMIGREGEDTYIVDNVSDVIVEGYSPMLDIDTVKSSVISIDLKKYGSYVENGTLTGSLNLNLTGNDGANTLNGNSGKNIITGGLGYDTMTGGTGADVFLFKSEGGVWFNDPDVITDFTRGVDKIDLSGIDTDTAIPGDQAFKFSSSQVIDGSIGSVTYILDDFAGTVDDKTVIYLYAPSWQQTISLKGLQTLSAADFIL